MLKKFAALLALALVATVGNAQVTTSVGRTPNGTTYTRYVGTDDGKDLRFLERADSNKICLLRKSDGRNICKTYAAWRETAKKIESRKTN